MLKDQNLRMQATATKFCLILNSDYLSDKSQRTKPQD